VVAKANKMSTNTRTFSDVVRPVSNVKRSYINPSKRFDTTAFSEVAFKKTLLDVDF
jgi:hypothetical protein